MHACVNEWDLHTSGLPADMHSGTGNPRQIWKKTQDPRKQNFKNRIQKMQERDKGKDQHGEARSHKLKATEIWGLFLQHN